MRAKKGTDGVYDFDALVVEPRLARVGGEVVDVSVIPVAVTLALAKHSDRTREDIIKATDADAEGEMRKMLQMVSDVCIVSNPKLTVDFLMQHLDQPRLNAFTKFVLMPVTDEAERLMEGGGGNAETDEPQ